MTERVRERHEDVKTLTKSREYKVDHGYTPVTFDIDDTEKTENMTDVVTPGYAQISASGGIVNNPCDYVKTQFIGGHGGISHQRYGTQTYDYYYIYGPGSLTGFHLAKLTLKGSYLTAAEMPEWVMEESKAQAMGNLDRTPYSFAEDIAELRETMRFLREPLAAVNRLADKIEKVKYGLNNSLIKRVIDRAEYARAIADLWLQYRFALMPLYRTIDDAFKAYVDNAKPTIRRTARGKTPWSKSSSEVQEVGSASNHKLWERSVEQENELKAGILYEVSNPQTGWRSKYGLRFKDIPETLWAIVPFSFMMDRVYNVSESIRGIVNFLDPRVNILAAWTTTKSNTVRSLSFVGHEAPPNWHFTIEPDVDTKIDFRYTRTPWTPTASDSFPASSDVIGLVDSVTKVADLLALLHAIFRKKPVRF